MSFRYHILFWLAYLLLESFLVFALGEWGLRSYSHSIIYHASLLIPRVLITYVLIYTIIPYSLKNTYSNTYKLVIYILYFITCLLFYRVFLNFISWPLIMNHSPIFEVFDLRLSVYSFFKIATPLSLLLAILSAKKEYATRLRNEELEKEKYKAELQFLKAQINPHFLFNTLNSLYVLALDKSEKTADAIAKLASLFRYVLEKSTEEQVTLGEEIRILQDYLDLEKLRYQNKMDMEFQIDVKDETVSLPPLLMLPFVENVFKHGASESIDHAWIRISILQNQTNIRLICENSYDPELSKDDTREGKGIKNILRRLTLLYGGRFSYQQTNEDNLFTIKLKLPLEKDGRI